jgi:hypothetical protein
MNNKDDEITHPGMLSKLEKHLIWAQFTNSPWIRVACHDCPPAAIVTNTLKGIRRSSLLHLN